MGGEVALFAQPTPCCLHWLFLTATKLSWERILVGLHHSKVPPLSQWREAPRKLLSVPIDSQRPSVQTNPQPEGHILIPLAH